jgi:hypothetical protein
VRAEGEVGGGSAAWLGRGMPGDNCSGLCKLFFPLVCTVSPYLSGLAHRPDLARG